MKNQYIRFVFIAAILSFTFGACDDLADPLIEETELDRPFTPLELEATIKNLVTIELEWKVREGVDHYVVEFSADSLEFNQIIRTVTVAPDEVPIQESFFGDTRYSARVKAVSAETAIESKWAEISIRTSPENIFTLPLENGDVEATEATLKWTAGSEVTHFVITPGNEQRAISAEEKAAGEATITGLTGYTDYSIAIYSDASKRGTVILRTLADPDGPNAVSVGPGDDLNAVITAAAPGAVLVLEPGDYLTYSGTVTINKSIAIRGHYPDNMPVIHVNFLLENAAQSIEFSDLEMDGDGALMNIFEYKTAGVDYGSLLIRDCNIHDYTTRLVYGNVASKVASFSIENCIVTDVDVSNGGDLIDFRTTYVATVSVTNSTFDNCAPGRDFIRVDAAAGYSGTGLTSSVTIDQCTLYGVSNTSDRILYVRFAANTSTVKNTIIAATDGYYTNQPATSQPVCSDNNYFNAAGFFTEAYVTNAKHDNSGTHTTLDPGFSDAANGNFTISNQTLIDNEVGDPRWRQ